MSDPLIPRLSSHEEYTESLRIAKGLRELQRTLGPMTKGQTIRAAVLLAVFGGTVAKDDDDESKPADPVVPVPAKNNTINDTPKFDFALPTVERIDL